MNESRCKPGPAPGARYSPPWRTTVRINNAFALWFRGASPPAILGPIIRPQGTARHE